MIKEKELWVNKIPYLKKLKNFYSGISHNNINLWPIMAGEVYTYYKDQDRKIFERIFLIIRFLFFKDNLKIEKNKEKILASYFMSREDHHELVKKALKKFPKKEVFFLDAYEHKKNPLLNYSFSFPNLLLLFKTWDKFRKSKLKNILGRYYYLFIARTYQRYKQIDYFKGLIEKLSPSAYIAFCSPASGEEAILTLISKQKKIPTFTLQHGLIPEYPYFTSVSILNENIISDYHILWGKNTYDIQKRYADESKLIIAGNPKYSGMVKRNNKNFLEKGLVLFPVTEYYKTKAELINIIKEIVLKKPKIEFYISVHPFDDLKDYKRNIAGKNVIFIEKDMEIKDFFEKVDFVILHNTTLAMETLGYSLPILRYNDEYFVGLWKNEDTFKDLDELEKLINKIKNKKTLEKWLKVYEKEFKKNFYFHPKKSVSQIYYEKIKEKIKEFSKIK